MTDDPYPSLLEAALALHAAGLCVLPAADDGSKRPAVDWKRWQTERPSIDQLRAWFAPERQMQGLGVVAGAVSGGIELTEIESRAVDGGAGLRRLLEAVEAAGERPLWDKLVNGFSVASPSGGIHIVHRNEGMEVPGNTKLAATAEHVTLAETRGEGGWFVTAPSFGNVHPTKRPWAQINGGPATIPTITADERDRFHALIRTLDERPVAAPVPAPVFGAMSRGLGTDGVSPGDDYTAKTSWEDLLAPAGWTRLWTRGEVTYWRRPGKREGVSASTGYQGDWLYVFTSSTELEPERTYTRFGAYAAIHHHGDHQAAAKALQGQGYGKAATVITMPVRVEGGTVAGAGPIMQGSLAVDAATGEVIPLATAFGLTDVGNAKLLVAQYGHRLAYCPERGQWLRWAESRWAFDEAGEHVELAKATLEQAARDYADDKPAAQHFARSLSWRGIQAAIALARTDPAVVVHADQLDARRDLLCTPGGVVDLRTGELRAPERGEFHTRSARVTPDASCPTPRWLQFLADTFGGDAELIAYVQRLAGYFCTGEVSAHILPFLYGASGQNGKSAIMEVFVKLLGGYAGTAPGAFLTAGHSAHETEIARLAGRRLLSCSETEPGARFAEAKVKMLTGGDRIAARFMRQDHFEFDPTCKLVLMANDRPAVGSGGNSFWRRLRLLEFRFQVPPERRVDGLAELMVSEEGPGILAWMVAGAVSYYAGGLAEPAGVKASTAEYAHAEDDLGRFIEERLVVGEGQVTQTSLVTAAYSRWCADEGVEPVSHKRLGMALRTRCGVETARSGGLRFYRGVALLPDDDGRTPFGTHPPARLPY